MNLPTRKAWLALACLALVVSTAQAASVHLKKGTTIEVDEQTLTLSASLAGLGNQDVTITIVAEGDASVLCLNPSGFLVPGQNRVPVITGASATISASEIKNGNLSFSLTTQPPEDPTWQEAGCPNRNWDAFIDEVDFTGVTLIVEQGGRVVLRKTFTPE